MWTAGGSLCYLCYLCLNWDGEYNEEDEGSEEENGLVDAKHGCSELK